MMASDKVIQLNHSGLDELLDRLDDLLDVYDDCPGGFVPNGLEFDPQEYDSPDYPFDVVEWETAPVEIVTAKGDVVFREEAAEFPASWDQEARAIVAQKYFYGDHSQGFRETSLKQLLIRVSATITIWAAERRTFRTCGDAATFFRHLLWIQLDRQFAFNSPVYFNVGVDCYAPNPSPENYRWEDISDSVVPCEDANRHPQVSACFIQSVEDNMKSIMDLASSEAFLFKRGSGTGTDLTPLRSEKEKLSGGGKPSGPVSFMRVYDAVAGIVKSGGKCLASYQPVFTASGIKSVKDLADSASDFTVLAFSRRLGRVAAKTARAWQSGCKPVVAVVTDKGEFHVSADHPFLLKTGQVVRAVDLKRGQSMLSVNTVKNGDYVKVGLIDGKSGAELLHRLVASDVMGRDIRGRVIHHGKRGKSDSEPRNLTVLDGQAEHAALHGRERIAGGTHVFQRQSFSKAGEANGMHADSPFWKDATRSGEYRAKQGAILKAGGRAVDMQSAARKVKMLNLGYQLINSGYDIETFEEYVDARREIGRRCPSVPGQLLKFSREFGSYDEFYAELRRGNHKVVEVRTVGMMDVYSVEVDDSEPDDKRDWTEHNYVIAPLGTTEPYINGLVCANTRRAAKMQTLKYHHPDIMKFVECKRLEEDKVRALIAAGYDPNFNAEAYSTIAFQNANLSVRVTDYVMEGAKIGASFTTRAVTTGNVIDTIKCADLIDAVARSAWDCGDPALQFEDRIQEWHTVPNHGPINSSNPCSEYMHIDDSACNLASLNMIKFRVPALRPGDASLFDSAKFRRCVRVAITAMESMVDSASYPTEKIALNSHRFRPLGIGFANVGCYAMLEGIPYDSDEARSLIAGFGSALTGEAYAQSARLARRFGPFDGFAADRDNMLRVIAKHRDKHDELESENSGRVSTRGDIFGDARDSWDEALRLGTESGFRNSQVSVIAPTGTISFMMGCDTFGVEPEIALVRFKSLAGGGMLKLVNRTVPETLRNLGYSDYHASWIIDHIEKYNTIEDVEANVTGCRVVGTSGLKPEHLPIFDCAFPPSPVTVDGKTWRPIEGRSIGIAGHVGVMAKLTPFISGAISKTANVPNSFTPEQIKDVYMMAWEQGCKSIAVYRDGSKGNQPVATSDAETRIDGYLDRDVKMLEDENEAMLADILAAFPYLPPGPLRDKVESEYVRGGVRKGPVVPVAASMGPVGLNGHMSASDVPASPSVGDVTPPARFRMPTDRDASIHKFSIDGHEGFIISGFVDDGSGHRRIGEVFIEMSKQGSTLAGLMDTIGVLISLSLQHNVPLAKLVEKLENQNFEPKGITPNPDIRFCKSIIDYVARHIGCMHIPGYRQRQRPLRADGATPARATGETSIDDVLLPAGIGPNFVSGVSVVTGPTLPVWDTFRDAASSPGFAAQSHGNPCPSCGSILIRQGSCDQCFSCGFADGGCGG